MNLDDVNDYLSTIDYIVDTYECFSGVSPTNDTLENFRYFCSKISTFPVQKILDGIMEDSGVNEIFANIAIVRFKLDSSRSIPVLVSVAEKITDEDFLGDGGYREGLFSEAITEIHDAGKSGYHVFSENVKEHGALSDAGMFSTLILFRCALVNANKSYLELVAGLRTLDDFVFERQKQALSDSPDNQNQDANIEKIKTVCNGDTGQIEALMQLGVNTTKISIKEDVTASQFLSVFLPLINTGCFPESRIKSNSSQKDKAKYLSSLFSKYAESNLKKEISKNKDSNAK